MDKKTFRPRRKAKTETRYPAWDARSRRDFLLALGGVAATGLLTSLGCSDDDDLPSGKPDTPPAPKDQGGAPDMPAPKDVGLEWSPDVYIKDLGGAVDAPKLSKDLKR